MILLQSQRQFTTHINDISISHTPWPRFHVTIIASSVMNNISMENSMSSSYLFMLDLQGPLKLLWSTGLIHPPVYQCPAIVHNSTSITHCHVVIDDHCCWWPLSRVSCPLPRPYFTVKWPGPLIRDTYVQNMHISLNISPSNVTKSALSISILHKCSHFWITSCTHNFK